MTMTITKTQTRDVYDLEFEDRYLDAENYEGDPTFVVDDKLDDKDEEYSRNKSKASLNVFLCELFHYKCNT